MCGLCSLRTNSCCCGISLRTGTITILILNLIGEIYVTFNQKRITNYGMSFWVMQIVFVAIEVAALYGVFKKKPDFLIPHLALTAIFLIVLLIIIIGLLIMLPFASNVLENITYQTPDGKTEHLNKLAKETFYMIYALIIVITLIYEAVKFHFFKVVLSHYRELKINLLSINPPPIGFVA